MALTPQEQIELETLRAKYGAEDRAKQLGVPVMGVPETTPAQQEAQRRETIANIEGAATPLAGFGMTRQDIKQGFTGLPTLGAIAGGLFTAANPELRVVQALSKMSPYAPSLAGSSAGTLLGTGAEQLLTGKDLLSKETAQKALGNLVENAAYDVGGNLIFSLAGKVYRAPKQALESAGISKGLFDTEEGAARKAAQEWLSARGATLTEGQLTGSVGKESLETALKVSSGAPSFIKQQKGVEAALKQGVAEVKSTLETSDAFKQALTTTPTNLAVGDRFQGALKVAEEEMKAKFKPVYEKIDADKSLFVNLTAQKKQAQLELDKLKERNFVGAGAEKRKALEEIVGLPDEVPFSTAHAIRSDLLAAGREAAKEGVPTTALQAEYNRQVTGLNNAMDRTMVSTFSDKEQKELARKLGFQGGIDSPAGLREGQYKAHNIVSLDQMNIARTPANAANYDLLKEYLDAQKGYKSAMEGFYGGSMQAALKASPSDVGAHLFNEKNPENLRDAYKAVAEVQKYSKDGKGLLQELQFGYLSDALSTPEKIASFATKMKDPEFEKTFNYLFRDTASGGTRDKVKQILNAAEHGLEKAGGSTVLRTQLLASGVGAAQAAVGGGLAYLALPSSVTDKLDLSTPALSAGVLYFTPKILSKMMTDKATMDVLANIAKASKQPKYGGAVAAKLVDQLNKSGIIDSDYISAVEAMASSAQPAPQQAAPENVFTPANLTPQEQEEYQKLQEKYK